MASPGRTSYHRQKGICASWSPRFSCDFRSSLPWWEFRHRKQIFSPPPLNSPQKLFTSLAAPPPARETPLLASFDKKLSLAHSRLHRTPPSWATNRMGIIFSKIFFCLPFCLLMRDQFSVLDCLRKDMLHRLTLVLFQRDICIDMPNELVCLNCSSHRKVGKGTFNALSNGTGALGKVK